MTCLHSSIFVIVLAFGINLDPLEIEVSLRVRL